MSRGSRAGSVAAIFAGFGVAQLGAWGLCVTIAPGVASLIRIDCTALLVLGIVFVALAFLLAWRGGDGGGI